MSEVTSAPSLAKRLRTILSSDSVAVLMEAHNGLSAKLAAEAGFQALWGSGLSISAALGVRDNNEASWTQVLEVLEFMVDAAELPILLDGDTGYGNFNNVRRLVRKLEQRRVAGVCLEDKLFPKTNSFIDGERQALAEVDEFCGKMRAAKDTQLDPDFVVVARTEAFIAGWGLDEALLRAHAYAEAGADVILVHSKRKDSREILSFMEQWDDRAPVVIVPTKYPTEPISRFVRSGITNFIFANQSLRTVITALQQNLRTLKETQDLMSVENDIAPVSEIFRLQNVQELKTSEERYLPSSAQDEARAVVLAASKGDFGELVKDRPKAMLRLRGKPIMTWHTDAFRRQGIRRIAAVRGYCKDAIDLADIQYFDNDEWASTGELASLYTAREFLQGDLVIAYGDIVFDEFILRNLLAQTDGIGIAVDGGWKLRERADAKRDLVITEGAYDPVGLSECKLVAIGEGVAPEQAAGEWIGLAHFRADKTAVLVKLLDQLGKEAPEALRTGALPMLLGRLVAAGETVSVAHTFGHWYDLDEQKDLLLASAQVKS
ncbi:MAG: phosphoenolpyruvate mutase [Myxococcales bacterium]|nr:phosphoenolpyruvate mutase [Myxococcales bacterium]